MPKDDATWLSTAYVMFGVCIAFVVWKALQTAGLHYGWTEQFDTWFPMASVAVSVAAGAASSWYLRKDAERHEYFLSAIGELRKVTWPSSNDTKRMTLIVVVVVGAFAVVLTVFDIAWARILKLLIA